MPAQLLHRNKILLEETAYFDYASEGWSKFPDKVAVIDVNTNTEATFGELKRRVENFAGSLQKLGVKSQTKVQFYCDNSLNSLVAEQASWFCNASVFCFKPNKTTRYPEYKHQTEEAEIEFVITDGVNYDVAVHELLCDPDCRVKNVIIVHGKPKKPAKDHRLIFAENLPQGPYRKPQGVRIKEDVLMVSYTSGSTGLPKGVMHSNYTMVAALRNAQHLDHYLESDRYLLPSTITYISGVLLSCGPLANGTTVILASHDFDPDFPIYVEKYKATLVILLECPMKTIIDNAHRFPNLEQMLDSIRVAYIGGTVFPEQLRKQTSKFFGGKKFVNLYGQTEALGMVTCTDFEDEMTKHVGIANSHAEVRVVTDSGAPVEVGQPGEIQWKGATMTLGYWKRELDDMTDDGFFATGDIGVIDRHGKLSIVGRKKHFIICLDERISPTEIEDLLLGHLGVSEVVVVPVPHPVVQEAPTAMVVIDDAYKRAAKFNEDQLRKELIHLVADKLSDNKHLHGGVYFLDALDKTESGKYARPAITKKAVQLSGAAA